MIQLRLNPTRDSQQGSTLIELLVATIVVALVLTAVGSGLTHSFKSTSEAQYRSIATQKAQEAMEGIRQVRNTLSWEAFQALFTSGSGFYCFNTDPVVLADGTGFNYVQSTCSASETIAIANIPFTRQAYITKTATSVSVKMTVSWDTGMVHSVNLYQDYYQW